MDGGYDLPVGRCFKTFDEFEKCLKIRSQTIGEKWRKATGNSRVEKENAKIKNKSKHYRTDLKYAYVYYRCIHEGQFISRGCQQREKSSRKIGCPAKFKLVAQRQKDALVVTQSLLQHNHPLLPPADGQIEDVPEVPPLPQAQEPLLSAPLFASSIESFPQNGNNWVLPNTYERRRMSTVIGSHSCLNGLLDDFPGLKAIVPDKYIYHVCNYIPEENGFRCLLRLPFKYKEQCVQWKKELETQTSCTLRVMKSTPDHNVFKTVYLCHLSNHGKPREQFGCQTYVSVEIKRTSSQDSMDDHLPELPCVVDLQWNHNHELKSPEVSKSKEVSKSTRGELVSLFRLGYSAESALGILKKKVHSKLGVEYHEDVFADKSIVPDISYVSRLRCQEIHKKSDTYLDELSHNLDKQIESHIRKYPGTVAMKKTEDGHVIIAIANEFMKNVSYQLKDSKDIMYVKSRDNCNRRGCHVYLLLTMCHAGGLPLGCLITTYDETATIVQGFQLYMSLMTDQAFFGQGYPSTVMAPDSSPEGEALRLIFPHSTHLISTYHILNSSWKLLNDKDNKLGIIKKQKIYVYSLLRKMIVSTSIEELECHHRTLLAKYPSLTTYSAYLYATKELWGLCFRKYLPVYYGDIDKYIDAELTIFKENIFSGTNGFNLVQLFDVVIKKVIEHYLGKITTGSLLPTIASVSTVDYPLSAINKVSEEIFMINCHVGQRHFYVNTDMAGCTCYAGMKGEHCEHIRAVELYFPDSSLKAACPMVGNLSYLVPTTNYATHLDMEDDFTEVCSSTDFYTGQSDDQPGQYLNTSSSNLDLVMHFDDACNNLNSETKAPLHQAPAVLKMDMSLTDTVEQTSVSLHLIEPHSLSAIAMNKGSHSSNLQNFDDLSALQVESSESEAKESQNETRVRNKSKLLKGFEEMVNSEKDMGEMQAVYGNLDYIRGKLKKKVKGKMKAEERIKKLKQTWQQFEQLVRDKPDAFGPAVDAFLSNLSRLKAKDDIHLISALFKFGNTVK